jgi:hypothetical protein
MGKYSPHIKTKRRVVRKCISFVNYVSHVRYRSDESDSDTTVQTQPNDVWFTPNYAGMNSRRTSDLHKEIVEREYRLFATTGRAPSNWKTSSTFYLAMVPKYGNDTERHHMATLGWTHKQGDARKITMGTLEQWKKLVIQGSPKDAARVVDKLKACFAFIVELAESPNNLREYIEDLDAYLDVAFEKLKEKAKQKMAKRDKCDKSGPNLSRIAKRYLALKIHLNHVLNQWKWSIDGNRHFLGNGTYVHHGPSWYVA